MEILILVLLYYLSQNPDFSESVKPIMNQLKNSEQMLQFLKNLSQFTQTFSTFQSGEAAIKKEPSAATHAPSPTPKTEEKPQDSDTNKTPQSPTSGIADEFIEHILESYLKKR